MCKRGIVISAGMFCLKIKRCNVIEMTTCVGTINDVYVINIKLNYHNMPIIRSIPINRCTSPTTIIFAKFENLYLQNLENSVIREVLPLRMIWWRTVIISSEFAFDCH